MIMKKPLIIAGMYVFAACNKVTTLEARSAGLIPYDGEVAEPIIILAKNVELADFVLSCSSIHDGPLLSGTYCVISHHIIDNDTSAARPLIKLVTCGNTGFPYYINN